ncbi:uncharacterized protein LOC124668159 [Lolium rigidum]|uniref:uncharacterized protein LOC124668159 n=1 Tax=Lolium rigidum TaxID=89674 RepID=UPI001F5C84AB|nr:uncharacterized protein LOC124668159 [Lolium rigidum]
MTTLSTGVLQKLQDGMKSGTPKPIGEHRTAVLQVTDIVPADMDDKDLFPRHGRFYLKVSDSSHSIYVTLPPAQADLVLSNKLHVGQLVHVDRLDPGSPVPVIVGARLLPGRHPLVVGTPEPGKKAAPRRGSWSLENHGAAGVLASPKVVSVRPTALDFGERTPVRERPSASARGSASVRKSTSVMPRMVSRCRSFAADRGDPPPPSKIPRSPFPAEKSSMSCTASRVMSRRAREEEPSSPGSDDDTATSSKKRLSSIARVPVPAKLNALGKEAMEQREQAQKVALEALRNASATENVFRIYKMFSDVSKTARADAPAACFDGFLSFHQEAVQAVADIESIQAATSMAATAAGTSDDPPAAVAEEAAPPPNVLQEIAQNRAATPRRRGLLGFGGVSKSVSFAPGTLLDPSSRQDGGRSSSASRKCLAADKPDDKRSSAPVGVAAAHSALGSSLRMAKQMQAEAGSWFMEFLEAALETGLKKRKSSKASSAAGRASDGGCPQSLMLRVINWVEMEQSGGESRKAGHPRAAAVARKLRIKAKNP